MNKYHYNQAFKQGDKTVPYGNWFSWRLGAPVYLGETLLPVSYTHLLSVNNIKFQKKTLIYQRFFLMWFLNF